MFQQASVAGFSPGLVQGNLLPDGDGLWLLQNQLTDRFLRLLLPAQAKHLMKYLKMMVLHCFQGDAEKAADAPVSFLMDRTKPGCVFCW